MAALAAANAVVATGRNLDTVTKADIDLNREQFISLDIDRRDHHAGRRQPQI
jgi:hypothetical protein